MSVSDDPVERVNLAVELIDAGELDLKEIASRTRISWAGCFWLKNSYIARAWVEEINAAKAAKGVVQ